MIKLFKKNFFFILFLTITQTSLHAGWWDWYEDDNDYAYSQNYETIDYAAIRRIIEQELDHFFQPHSQISSTRALLTKFKEKAKREICKEIQRTCSYHSEAKKLAIQLAEVYAINFVIDWAERIAVDKLRNPPVNPNLINKHSIIKAIKQVIRSQAELGLSEKERRLTKLVQNLVKNVEVLIMQEIEYEFGY